MIPKYRTQLVKEYDTEYTVRSATTPDCVVELLNKMFDASLRAEEHVWEVVVDCKCKIVGVFELSIGGPTSSIVDNAAIARNAILSGAYGVILAHNHPSGETTPSREDINVTQKAKNALGLFDIQLLDHVIIGDGYNSLNQSGLM